jgi:hypothetical protein
MKDKTTHTRVIDAATTILVTDTEILATMARSHNGHNIIALKQDQNLNGPLPDKLESQLRSLDLKGYRLLDQDVFVSFPNIDKAILTSTQPMDLAQQSSDPICKSIDTANGHWAQIQQSKNGFIFGSTK